MADPRAGTSNGAGKILLALLCMAQFMLILDLAVVAVAVPSIQSQLGVSTADIQWVSTAYGLAFGGFLVAAGRAADLFGPKRILLAGLAVFALASAACGLAPGGGLLFVARAVQGFGAALVSPAALTLVTTSFGEGEDRNKALGIWGAVSSGGAIAGQLLGGVLTDLAGWRSIFLINVPIGIAVIVAVAAYVRKDRPRAQGRIDLPGAALLTAGVVLLVTAVTRAAEHALDTSVLATGAGGLLVLVAFTLHESRAAHPVVRLSMFRNRYVAYGNLVCMLTSGVGTVSVFLTTLYLQQVLGLSPMTAGLGFVPVTALILVVSMRIQPLVKRFGVRTLLHVSALCLVIGALLLSLVTVDGSYWVQVLPGLLFSGLGAALSFTPAMILCTTGVADEDQGLASGILGTSQQIGAAVFLAALNTVVAAVAAGGGPQALTDGFRAGFLWSLTLPVLMVVCVLALPRERAGQPDGAGTGDGGSAKPGPAEEAVR
ncbi:MFS transporter [Streptomyces sp. NBC_00487]|uniref:MFS transporter n=1 Tax=unclassified Streptomyces TaxID=2593676 RepID=UPI002E1962C8|nr:MULTISPECIES: MFS transporter [unclassified Streptomyces]